MYYGDGMEIPDIFVAVDSADSEKMSFTGKTEIVVFHSAGIINNRKIYLQNIQKRGGGGVAPTPVHLIPVNMPPNTDFHNLRRWVADRDPNHPMIPKNAMTGVTEKNVDERLGKV